MWMLKEEHNKLLNELIPKFEAEEAPADGKTRVILAGQPCTIPSESILNLVEELGAVVVDDHLYTGGEYPATDVKVNGDPLEALADHYLYRVPSIIKHDPTHYLNIPTVTSDYGDYLVQMVRKNEAKGIIFLRVMYCDPFDFQFVPVNNKLEKESIPSLSIITEHGVGPLEPIRTRIGAFLEMIKG
jgi:benzoyl-CoA reductase/2-hydroxyglutaryl-CoA dehydratase subunit BcrC/BadD/HgdB